MQLRFSVVWAGAVAAAAWLIREYGDPVDQQSTPIPWLPELVIPTAGEVETAVQVVPAIVVAIFVFAAGTSFVVAQVVPQSRGTRAVEVLRSRHLAWTIAPALALTPLTVLVLWFEQEGAWSLAAALLIGSVAYLLVSTGCLLSILAEATNPQRFAALLRSQHLAAVQMMRATSDAGAAADGLADRAGYGWAWLRSRWRTDTRRTEAVENLYGTVRTLRGWARSSATVGDSRELQIALEGILDLVADYAMLCPTDRSGVPREYTEGAAAWPRSVLR
jgi:hypothetical protein